ncbi:MAG: glyoxylate reductase [Calditrichia bacterium]
MEKLKVLVTHPIPQVGIELLQEKFEVEIYSGPKISRKQLLSKVKQVDGLLCLLSDGIDKELMDSAPRLKVVSNLAVGYDNIDVDYATRRGIIVTNTPGILTDATADLAWALLLAVCRRIVEGDQLMRSGQFVGWDPLMLRGGDLKNKTLGILGAGRIGTAFAERSLGWRMKILYFDKNKNSYLEKELGARKVSLDEVLSQSDFISLHLPLTEDTHHLINESALRKMKPGTYLINTARGAVVEESALVKALKEGWIAGAGLDVFENEPRIHPELARFSNVVLTPHIGSATIETRNEMSRIAARNLIAALEGKKPPFVVNPQVFDKI